MIDLTAAVWDWLKGHPFITALLAILLVAAILALLDLAEGRRR